MAPMKALVPLESRRAPCRGEGNFHSRLNARANQLHSHRAEGRWDGPATHASALRAPWPGTFRTAPGRSRGDSFPQSSFSLCTFRTLLLWGWWDTFGL